MTSHQVHIMPTAIVPFCSTETCPSCDLLCEIVHNGQLPFLDFFLRHCWIKLRFERQHHEFELAKIVLQRFLK